MTESRFYSMKLVIPAARYENKENCLAAAEADYQRRLGLPGYDLDPQWADDDSRIEIVLDLPRGPVRALMTEAAEAGDTEQVSLCGAALAGDQDAVTSCWDTIAEAQAQR